MKRTWAGFTGGVFFCFVAAGGTVYRAGEALTTNTVTAGSVNPYTDADGGIWSYGSSTTATSTNVTALTGPYTRGSGLKGFATSGGAPYVAVNGTGASFYDSVAMSAGQTLAPGELLMNVMNSGSKYAAVRFSVPTSGYYSAEATFRDLNCCASSANGADVWLLVGGGSLESGVVSIDPTVPAGAQSSVTLRMSARWLPAGTAIDFRVGPNGGDHGGDATGAIIEIRKVSAPSYDAGLALARNIAGAYTNPCMDALNGVWQYGDASSPSGSVTMLSGPYLRASGLSGFNSAGTLPYVCVNTGTVAVVDTVAGMTSGQYVFPNEILMNAFRYAVLRFWPPESGYYTVSADFRDVSYYSADSAPGADVWLVIGGDVFTNGVVSLENTTTGVSRVSFSTGPRFLLAGVPVDFAVGPNGTAIGYDATVLSVFIDRETLGGPVFYEAGSALAACMTSAVPANPFAAAGATWRYGTASSLGGTFQTFGYTRERFSGVKGWAYGASSLPYVLVNLNDDLHTDAGEKYNNMSAGQFVLPGGLLAHPGVPNSAAALAVARFSAPSSGVYRAYASFRDVMVLDAGGAKVYLMVDGRMAASGLTSIDSPLPTGARAVCSLDAGTLCLAAGGTVDFVIHPGTNHGGDMTAWQAVVLEQTNGVAGSIMNIDLDGFSALPAQTYAGAGRIGWAADGYWNSVPVSDATTPSILSQPFWLANRQARTSVRFALNRLSGSALAAVSGGGSGNALLDDYIRAADTNDVYRFALTGLVANASYDLYFFSSQGGQGDASGRFTVNGVSRTADKPWFLLSGNDHTAFCGVTANADGVIEGTFSSGSATNAPAAFNGLQIIGEYPPYVPTGTLISVN